ncbi:MAG: hypothetical protein HYR56_15950 [Acidobacteria bacterium]|nr:hypothetical protein [Acidobacteriota bacterium]MBI3426304.1 hypothetical protein [Acidobacteriota bacterium]
MNQYQRQDGDRNVNANEVSHSVIITGDQNQITINAAPLTSAPNLPPERLTALGQASATQLETRVSTVRIFGGEAPHPFDQVFVELSLNEEYERRPNQAEFLGLIDSELRRLRSVFGDADEQREQSPDDPAQRHLAKTKRTHKPDERLRRRTRAVITGASKKILRRAGLFLPSFTHNQPGGIQTTRPGHNGRFN